MALAPAATTWLDTRPTPFAVYCIRSLGGLQPGLGPAECGCTSTDTPDPRWLIIHDPLLGHWLVVGPGRYDGYVFTTLGEADHYRSQRLQSPADYNEDGLVNSRDFFDFYWAWLSGEGAAEWDGVRGLDSSDVFSYIRDFMDG